MYGCVPWKTLKLFTHVDELMHCLVGFVLGPQLRIHGKSFLKRYVKLVGDHLCNLIAIAVRKIHNPCHIADNTFGSKCTESDDLNNLVRTIFFSYIVNDVLPALVLEIHVDIRHGHTLRVKEPFKEKVILNRINVGYVHAIGDDTSRSGATARANCYIVLTAIVDVIPYNKEVIHITHALDDAKLIVKLFLQSAVIIWISLMKSIKTQFIQVSPGIVSFGYLEMRELCDTKFDLNVTSVRNFLRIIKSLFCIREKSSHFLFTFYVVLPAFIAKPVLVTDFFTSLDAQKKIVSFRVVSVSVMTVVSGNKRNIKFVRKS